MGLLLISNDDGADQCNIIVSFSLYMHTEIRRGQYKAIDPIYGGHVHTYVQMPSQNWGVGGGGEVEAM